ncbi:hypothetical protein H632_c151p0 [Helicosporidium sp. ATCC 50920]|nr:hypothetical protein H632_c151p0 [Helicosporidium sp. ATCC 50920]|eukprot:KDD76639.1 hypothetical protein H632_c151p0 [Helicosporidium sp. ATCC 50920]
MGASGSPSRANDAAAACERAEAASRLKALPYDLLLAAATSDAPADGSFLTLEAYKHFSPLMQMLRQPAQCERIVAWAADGGGADGGAEGATEDVEEAAASEGDAGDALHAELEASFGVESDDGKSEDDEAESEGGGGDGAGSDKGDSDIPDEDGLDVARELAEDEPAAADEESIHALALQRALKRCKVKSWEALEISICRRVNRRNTRAQRSVDALSRPASADEKLFPPLRLNDVLNARSPVYDAGFARRFRREKKLLVEKTSRRKPELQEPELAQEARFSALTVEQHAWLLDVGPVPQLAAALSQQHLEELFQRLCGLVRHERETYKKHVQATMQPAAQRRYEHATFRQQRQFEVRADALRARIRDLPRLWKLGQAEVQNRFLPRAAQALASPRKRKAEEGADAAAEVSADSPADAVTESELGPWTLRAASQTWDAILASSRVELVSAEGRARPWSPLPPSTAVPGDRTYVTAASASLCADIEELFLAEFGAGGVGSSERRGRLGRAAPRPAEPKVVAAAGTLASMLSEHAWEIPVRVAELHTLANAERRQEGSGQATESAVGRVAFVGEPLLPRRLTPRQQQWHLQMRACQALGALESSGDACTGIQIWSRCRSLPGADLYVLTSAEQALERGVSDAAEARQVPLVVHPRLEYFAPPAREDWHPAARLTALASKVLAGPAAALCTPRVHVPQAQVLECPVVAGPELCGGEGGRDVLALWVQRWGVVLEALDRAASLPAGMHLLVHDGRALSVLHAMPEKPVQDKDGDEGAADEAVPLPPQNLHLDALYDLHATVPLRGRTSAKPHPFVPPVWEPASPQVPQIPHTFRPRLSETEDAAGARRGGRMRRRRLDGPYAWRALGEKGDFDAVTHISTISRVDYAAALGDEL